MTREPLSQQELDQRYFKRLEIPVVAANDGHKAAFARAHELRKFEIENYWTRSQYFWGFQIVSFGALAITAKDGQFNPPVVLIVAVLGALAALTGLLTAKGSKFWQENWEAHIDFLEGKVEGNLHKTVLVKDGLSFSVSRVNERFLEILLFGWLASFLVAAVTVLFPDLRSADDLASHLFQVCVPLIAFVLGVQRLLKGQRSKLEGRAYDRNTMELLRK
ncbi:hypothetical protein [Novosphingobium sp. FKTRR1]|uniref:RipA family octameric membrane protein n=1 Tax=Novosphingobium sp. FKTRR1 TaxID=2879118 RepID=UPI001CF00916|nr:hypothetical protein [Novosphingobium sp. FKTRR1]